MTAEIRRYLDEHGDRYTVEALRAQLLEAGHEPAEVDAAIADWQRGRAAAATGPTSERRSRFNRTVALLHAGALLVCMAIGAFWFGAGSVVTIGIVGGIALLIGWGISWAIGRAVLSRSEMAVALIAPVLSVLLIGGSCLGLLFTMRGI